MEYTNSSDGNICELMNDPNTPMDSMIPPTNHEHFPETTNHGIQNERQLPNACFKGKLAAWAVSCRVPHTTLKMLLGILKVEKIDIPLDPRTLLKTPRSNNVIKLSNGDYQHYGIERGIRKVLDNVEASCNHPPVLKLAINIDDVPVNRILSLTVITGSLEDSQQVFLIGAFQPDRYKLKTLRTSKKKLDQDEFLIFIVDELIKLFHKGFDHNCKHYIVMLDFLCCDAPAKAKALKLRGHTGFSSCSKCMVKGVYINYTTCFPDFKALKRTDDEELLKTKAIWKNVPNYRFVTDTILDYMHLVCLGITKRLLQFWVEGNKYQNLGGSVIKAINAALANLQEYIPCDFVRCCDDLEFVSAWKATQFRQFLLYQGILALKNNVPKEIYKMFIHLSFGIRILCSNKTHLYSTGNKLLKEFIQMFIKTYGEQYCNHNIHGLSHIYVDVLNHGPLDKFSAFRFENFMQQIKKDVRKPGFVLAQFSNRMAERDQIYQHIFKNKKEFNRENPEGVPPLNCGFPQYLKFEFNGFKIDLKESGDNCFGTKSKKIIRIENVATKCGAIVLIGREFLKRQSFLTSPIDSTELDIYEVSELSQLKIWELEDIEQKFFIMPMTKQFLVVSLIHSDNKEYYI